MTTISCFDSTAAPIASAVTARIPTTPSDAPADVLASTAPTFGQIEFTSAELVEIKNVLMGKALAGNLRAVQLLLQLMRTPHYKHAENLESYGQLLRQFVRPEIRPDFRPETEIETDADPPFVRESAPLPTAAVSALSDCSEWRDGDESTLGGDDRREFRAETDSMGRDPLGEGRGDLPVRLCRQRLKSAPLDARVDEAFTTLCAPEDARPLRSDRPCPQPQWQKFMAEIINVACIQAHITDDRDANLQTARRLLEQAAAEGADVAVLPELSFDHFFPQHPAEAAFYDLAEPIPGPLVETLQEWANELSMIIVPNIFEKGSVGQCFDTSPVIAADGTLVGAARMVHIADLPGFHEKFYYTPGNTGPMCVRFDLGTLGVAICYDRHYPEFMRMLALQGADIVVVPSANLIDEPLDMFLTELRATAFQNGYFIAMANRVGEDGGLVFGGRSAIVGPDGDVLGEAATDVEAVLVVPCDLSQVTAERRLRPYFRDRRPEWYGLLAEPDPDQGTGEDDESDHDHHHHDGDDDDAH